VLRQVGQALGKMRRLSADFQRQFMDAMHEDRKTGSSRANRCLL
jgi:hypothetical protein